MISAILKNNGIYSSSDETLFEKEVRHRTISKDELLVKRGEVCRSIFFNITGSLYQYKSKDEIKENVIDLHADQEWVLNQISFTFQKPSDTFIKAYTDSRLLELSIESIHCLIAQSPAFLQLAKIFTAAGSRISFFDDRMTPAQKYQYILDNRNNLIQKFPLKYIASYLKMAPETLSRVRENFAKGVYS
ncbi:Crp/Fnr family transcriptional regulator [Chryseosolibacter indicus]|uniref:Crp/Fnr family transcriptional regulator n=1 Tax=Chryseosolibacter indicus TaxID=2782351 RepID=A0ABS5VP42_9BACT|nr:Crp/Fnr family transcriptional regulator [Chryseosolibacter indicus]MBT1703209.1 Crp/Fnr family transcriptional regulator [Chryseosolibacter indicus]